MNVHRVNHENKESGDSHSNVFLNLFCFVSRRLVITFP